MLELGIDPGLGQLTRQSWEQVQTPNAQAENGFVGRVQMPNRADHAGGGARRARAEPAAFQHGGPDSLFRQLISDGAAYHSATHDHYIRVL